MCEKTCILCSSFFIQPGTSDYSEYTPGEDISTGCLKNIWILYGEYFEIKLYRTNLLKAVNCNQFCDYRQKKE